MRSHETRPEEIEEATETSPLIAKCPPYGLDEDEVPAFQIWKQESKRIIGSSGSIVLTLFLQSSLIISSVFGVEHLGQCELGSVSVANMTATITGYAVYQGLSTSLDTL
ncbi:MATE efflux family protein [Phlyctema vagabunda]|uniref:MATE efflux family protein n=1 Tax=Phlyctema vagabunda TaxID=108571 RepID=A0ABR4P602_9HELO